MVEWPNLFLAVKAWLRRSENAMLEEILVLRVFDSELDAAMAQQMLWDAGVATFIFKDDTGGIEPHLQRMMGVRLVLKSEDAERAHPILQALESIA